MTSRKSHTFDPEKVGRYNIFISKSPINACVKNIICGSQLNSSEFSTGGPILPKIYYGGVCWVPETLDLFQRKKHEFATLFQTNIAKDRYPVPENTQNVKYIVQDCYCHDQSQSEKRVERSFTTLYFIVINQVSGKNRPCSRVKP